MWKGLMSCYIVTGRDWLGSFCMKMLAFGSEACDDSEGRCLGSSLSMRSTAECTGFGRGVSLFTSHLGASVLCFGLCCFLGCVCLVFVYLDCTWVFCAALPANKASSSSSSSSSSNHRRLDDCQSLERARHELKKTQNQWKGLNMCLHRMIILSPLGWSRVQGLGSESSRLHSKQE